MAVKNYLSKNNTTLAQEVLKYYNEKDGTSYATIEELLSKNETAMDELTKSGAADNASLKSLDPMLLHSSVSMIILSEYFQLQCRQPGGYEKIPGK